MATILAYSSRPDLTQKPKRFQINPFSPRATGLVSCLPTQPDLVDLASGVIPTLQAGVELTGDVLGGFGLNCTTTNRAAVYTTLPWQRDLRANNAGWTVSFWGSRAAFSQPVSTGVLFCGMGHQNPWASPFIVCGVGTNGSGNLAGYCLQGAGLLTISSSVASSTLLAQVPFHLALSVGLGPAAGEVGVLYLNGQPIASASGNTQGSLATSTGQIWFGCDGSGSRASGLLCSEMRIYRRWMSAAEILDLYNPTTRWDVYQQPSILPFTVADVATGHQQFLPLLGVA